MQLLNQTAFPSQAFDSIDQHGETFHVFVLRQTFDLTPDGLAAADEQEPLCDTDAFFGAVNGSGVRQESDFCPCKPRCDIIVNASAHAPSAIPVQRFETGLEVRRPERMPADPPVQGESLGECLLHKTLLVTGERSLRQRALPLRLMIAAAKWMTLGRVRIPAWRMTPPQPFTTLPLRYECAFGGEHRIDAGTTPAQRAGRMDKEALKEALLTPEELAAHPDAAATGAGQPLAHQVCEANPLGLGFARAWYLKASGGKTVAAPRIEYPAQAMTARRFCAALEGRWTPQTAGFGIVGRAWLPRAALVGQDRPAAPGSTLPRDFDQGYWNAAPADQQCGHLRGDECITLLNLCPAAHPAARRDPQGQTLLRFALPGAGAYLALSDVDGAVGIRHLAIDTVTVDPDASRVDIVWRAALPAAARLARVHLRIGAAGAAEAETDRPAATPAGLHSTTPGIGHVA
jgi:hypothetical protein